MSARSGIVATILAAGCATAPAAPAWMEGCWRGEREDGGWHQEGWAARERGMDGLHGQFGPDGARRWGEVLSIEERGNAGVFYVAHPEGQPPGEFRMVSADAGQAVFERPGE